MKEAYLYTKLDGDRVRCFLCSHRCLIKDGAKGICGVRENRGGTLFSLVYGKIIARHVDPIEKKPLFHFLPGSRSYSIAYTYTEPTIYYEIGADTARMAVTEGIRNVFVSNGYMTEECLKDIAPDLHGANVDLKAFSNGFYKEQCGAKLEPVLQSIETMVETGVWLEVTTLLIPGLNDSDDELNHIARFLAGVDPNIPWHISRFHPTYRLTDVPSTSPEIIHHAKEIGLKAGLRYVYTGNLPGDDGEKTYCHECGELLIDRFGFSVRDILIRDNVCPRCNTEIPGVWK
jgi:pyruvate formate lyase activating enzyme